MNYLLASIIFFIPIHAMRNGPNERTPLVERALEDMPVRIQMEDDDRPVIYDGSRRFFDEASKRKVIWEAKKKYGLRCLIHSALAATGILSFFTLILLPEAISGGGGLAPGDAFWMLALPLSSAASVGSSYGFFFQNRKRYRQEIDDKPSELHGERELIVDPTLFDQKNERMMLASIDAVKALIEQKEKKLTSCCNWWFCCRGIRADWQDRQAVKRVKAQLNRKLALEYLLTEQRLKTMFRDKYQFPKDVIGVLFAHMGGSLAAATLAHDSWPEVYLSDKLAWLGEREIPYESITHHPFVSCKHKDTNKRHDPKACLLNKYTFISEKDFLYLMRELSDEQSLRPDQGVWEPTNIQPSYFYSDLSKLAKNGWLSFVRTDKHPVACNMNYVDLDAASRLERRVNRMQVLSRMSHWGEVKNTPTFYLPYSLQLAEFYKFEEDPAYRVEYLAPDEQMRRLVERRTEILLERESQDALAKLNMIADT